MNSIYHDIARRTDGDIYIGVVGPVRTGKSTLIKVLCGIHKRDGGTIELFGKEVDFDNIVKIYFA